MHTSIPDLVSRVSLFLWLVAGRVVFPLWWHAVGLVGRFCREGEQWLPAKEPIEVQGHDFPGPDVPRAYPYGIYDLGRNTGFVNLGTDHDTGAFAVASIRGWWRHEGRRLYPAAKDLLITAGGENIAVPSPTTIPLN